MVTGVLPTSEKTIQAAMQRYVRLLYGISWKSLDYSTICRTRFSNQWRQLRFQQLFREDIQSLEKINNIAQLELLAEILCEQASGTLNYRSLASDIYSKRCICGLILV